MTFHDQLLSLNGRLDLVVAQIELKASVSKALSVAATHEVGTNGTAKYVEGEESSESSDEGVRPGDGQESEEEDIEDLVLDPRATTETRSTSSVLPGRSRGSEDDEDLDDEDDEDEIPAPIRKKKSGLSAKPRINGFVDIEAEESDGEDSDLDASLRKTIPNGFAVHEDDGDEDEDDEDAEDLDAYESDFINDSEEQSDEDCGDE